MSNLPVASADDLVFDDMFEGIRPSGTGPPNPPTHMEDEPLTPAGDIREPPPPTQDITEALGTTPSLTTVRESVSNPSSPDKGWNDDVNQIVSSLGKKVYGLRELNDLAGADYERRSRRLGGALIITSSIASLFTVVDGFSFLQIPGFPLSYALKILNPVITFMTVWSRFRDYSAKAANHRNAAKRLRNLLTSVQSQLVKNTQDRTVAGAFLDASFRQFEQINSEVPEIPQAIVKDWNKRFQGTIGVVSTQAAHDANVSDEERGLGVGPNLRNLSVAVDPNSILLQRHVTADGSVMYTIAVDPLTQLRLTEFAGADINVT
jgi:hypothetical protein